MAEVENLHIIERETEGRRFSGFQGNSEPEGEIRSLTRDRAEAQTKSLGLGGTLYLFSILSNYSVACSWGTIEHSKEQNSGFTFSQVYDARFLISFFFFLVVYSLKWERAIEGKNVEKSNVLVCKHFKVSDILVLCTLKLVSLTTENSSIFL